ncbi:hypothetical protein OL548_20000 [Lysinibacillus sp. MHQ-1]|nr:hypothetical protein OL548_20000 [Lysinibacillus sp. MHQ-1]
MYDIPKEIKAKPKFVGLEVKELIILLVSFFLFFTVLKDLVHGMLFIPYILIAGGTLFWMVLPSSNNPRLKKLHVIVFIFQAK